MSSKTSKTAKTSTKIAKPDRVEEAELESFPASDPPSYSPVAGSGAPPGRKTPPVKAKNH